MWHTQLCPYVLCAWEPLLAQATSYKRPRSLILCSFADRGARAGVLGVCAQNLYFLKNLGLD